MQVAKAENASSERNVTVHENHVDVRLESGLKRLPLVPLPDRMVEWMEAGRRSIYDKIQNKGKPAFFSSHLPVMVTWSGDKEIPFNCSNKGVGLIPNAEYLDHYIELFRTVLRETKGRPWQESMAERIKAVSSFYFNREAIDFRALSTLEIFQKTTYRNLMSNPVASLHYTGNAPDYMSFQVNCAVEVIGPDDPRHTFIKLARVMFEYDSFHIAQHEFPHAYVLWITEVSDKTPFRVPEKPGKILHVKGRGDLEWDPEAMQSVNRAPGMVRQFITESIEKYARSRGFTRIDAKVVQEAREVMERPEPSAGEEKSGLEPSLPVDLTRYQSIYVGLDSSELSAAATELAVGIGKAFGSKLHGSHVYAAKMHDNRFRAMEGGLPAEYRQEKELEKQRKIHDSLITKGLELITDSYLEVMAQECQKHEMPYTPISLEGKNWKALSDDINANGHDLVVFGGFGIGRVSRSLLGSVTERTLRRVRRDFLICKRSEASNQSDTIVVCLDGSERSWGGLQRAFVLAKKFEKRIVAVSAFDPYFHYAMFKSLNKALTDKARKVFKFEEQEKLHEDIIDSGLAKIYQSYLNIAERLAEKEGIAIETRLLDGKPFEKILQYSEEHPPWLLVFGRIGFHSEEDMDLGSNTENLCRLAACNLLVVESKSKPPVEFQAEETVSWTVEAKERMNKVPDMARPMAMKAIQGYCVAEGHTVITESILFEALGSIMPPEALARMGINLETKRKAESEVVDRIDLTFRCPICGYSHHGSRPIECPVCGREGAIFQLLETAETKDGESITALGNRKLTWDRAALEQVESIGDPIKREQLRNRVEKRALTDRIGTVTVEMVRAAHSLQSFSATPITVTSAPSPQDPVTVPKWTEAGLARLDRVPEGFMRKASREFVEKYAVENGHAEINLEVADAGLGKARAMMCPHKEEGGKSD